MGMIGGWQAGAVIAVVGAAIANLDDGAPAGPPPAPAAAPPPARFVRAADGFFYADARVNGRPVRFLVDTGASGIILSPGDARRAGVAADRLRFGGRVATAGGGAAVAWIELARLNLAGQSFGPVRAAVLRTGTTSLLGQDVLARFRRVSIERDALGLE